MCHHMHVQPYIVCNVSRQRSFVVLAHNGEICMSECLEVSRVAQQAGSVKGMSRLVRA